MGEPLKDSRYMEGTKMLEFGRLDEAEAFFSDLLQEDPYHYEAINKMGVIRIHQKDLQSAKMHFEKAVEINPQFAPALVNIGNLFLENQDYEMAKKYYLEAINQDGDYPMSFYNLALVFKKNGDYKKFVDNMKTYKRLTRRRMPDEDDQFRLHFKRKMGCLPTMIVTLVIVAVVAIGVL